MQFVSNIILSGRLLVNENDIDYLKSRIAHGGTELERGYYQAKLAKIQGDHQLAALLFVEQAKANPIALFHQLAGECFLQLKQYPEAILYLAAAVGLNEKQQKARYLLGVAQYETGNLRNAQSTFERVLAIEPQHKKAQNFLKQFRQEQGETDADSGEGESN